ncbi:DUF4440 domain-containing protein [Muricauda sp. JGD-17]|uniref:DUF4440 domain-containing protein n=1 Tax=Flagellimonas ochracea TaxID=2696472 RepID=A0A964T9T1_9FLAO|nr:nuclear transport factor 2 family protein [Allomuricauda ochracea]NAY90868.1 DUF4440 domain-containing protein [Allomuricauda ochracea]
MKPFITPFFLLVFGLTLAQQQQPVQISEDILKSIEQDVWIPFMEAYDQSDSQKLRAIHSKNIIRVTMAQNQIEIGEAYLDNFGNFVENVKENGSKIGIAFALLTTALDKTEQLAYQTGYYRFSSKHHDEKELMVRGYGEFSVVLKKENGQWKIWLDADKRINLSHEDFNGQKMIYKLK